MFCKVCLQMPSFYQLRHHRPQESGMSKTIPSIKINNFVSYFRIESYSCKMIGTDKQLYKKFNAEAAGRTPQSLEALSPPHNGYGGYTMSHRQRTRVMSASQSSDEVINLSNFKFN